MKKTTFVIIALLLGLALLSTGCKLPASGEPITALATATSPVTGGGEAVSPSQAAPESATSGDKGAPTATEALPMPTPVVVTATSAPATAAPATAAPTTAPTQAPPPAASSTPLPAGSRIQFASGATSATVDGVLDAHQAIFYLVGGASGQRMTVVVWSPNGDVALGISGASTGQVLLDSALRDSSWTGSLPALQDYYLTIVAGDGATSYSVSVEITGAAAGGATAPPPPGLFNPIAAYGLPNMVDPMNGGNIGDWANLRGELPDTANIRLEVDDARFYVTGKWTGFSTWWFSWRELSDFYLEMTVDSGSCSGLDAYGLIVRGPEHLAGVSYGYVIAFSCDGHYWVYRLDGANPFTAVDLVSWTASDFILRGSNQHNVIGVEAVGNELTIYANGHELTTVTEDRYDFGRYGLFVRPDVTTNYTYRVINMSLWDLGD